MAKCVGLDLYVLKRKMYLVQIQVFVLGTSVILLTPWTVNVFLLIYVPFM